MSIVAKKKEGYFGIVKGSPEKIQELSLPSTLPLDYVDVLESYAKKGFRIIGLGVKKLDITLSQEVAAIEREDIEGGLTFLGFLIMQNKLKPITASVIKELNDCEVRTIMATGDNILTAISVA